MARATPLRRWSARQEWNPLRAIFRLFTSVRFAIGMGLTVAVAALLGVIFPQAPDAVRLNPAAYDAWMEDKGAAFGILAPWMRNAGLFEVFRSIWFNGLFFVLLASVAVCTFNRIAPTWRMLRRPVRRVNDRYFDRAHARASLEGFGDAAAVERTLRAARYRVERVEQRDGAIYLFADRFPWAAMATFLTHASLIVFLAGGIVSKLIGFDTFVQVVEGGTAPVFPVLHPNQMQIENLDSYEGRDARGNIIDYWTQLVIYRGGREVCRGKTTVNDPLPCEGYRFHQAAFSGDAVALRVRDLRTGAAVYAEAPILEGRYPSPRLVIRDAAGAVLFDRFLTLAPLDDRRALALAPVEQMQQVLPVVMHRSADDAPWQLSIVRLSGRGASGDAPGELTIHEGQRVSAGGLDVEYAETRALPSLALQGIPGLEPVGFLQLVTEADGTLTLDLQNPARPESAAARMELRQGQPLTAGDYEYTFVGPRAYTGVQVRRDPGSWLIWTATAMMMVGLAVTFWVPRRRLWVRITPDRTQIAGIAERTAHLSDELRRLLERARDRR